jgi:hypothetical protein
MDQRQHALYLLLDLCYGHLSVRLQLLNDSSRFLHLSLQLGHVRLTATVHAPTIILQQNTDIYNPCVYVRMITLKN